MQDRTKQSKPPFPTYQTHLQLKLRQHSKFQSSVSWNFRSSSTSGSVAAMGMEVHWYDFVCFGIVGVAFCGSLWVILKKEGSGKFEEDRTRYESLLVARPDCEGYVGATRLGHVSSSQLWSSCWRGVHPVWLLFLRSFSFFVMIGFLVWDVLEWDASIFIYYTE